MTRLRAMSVGFAMAMATMMATAGGVTAEVGYTTVDMVVAHRSVPVPLHIWYPAMAGGEAEMLGQNALFQGVNVVRGAVPVAEALPVVMLSHGSGGNAVGMGWLAAGLAERGMIVVAPNHPGTTSRDSDPLQTVKVWERPADISAALDLIAGAAPLGIRADMGRVAVVGFSLGGHTAMALGGARASKAAFISYCGANNGMLDCGWLADGGVDLNAIDQARYEQDNRDARIRAVVAIDPALSQAYVGDSLAAMEMPVMLLAMGQAGQMAAAIDSAPVAAKLPNAVLHYVPGALHFSMLAECRGLGRVAVWLFGDGPICSDDGRARADIHREVLDYIGPFLATALRPAGL